MTRVKNQETVESFMGNLQNKRRQQMLNMIKWRVPYAVIRNEIGVPGSWQNMRYYLTNVNHEKDVLSALKERESVLKK